MPRVKLTKSAIDALPTPASDVVYWDAGLPGFGMKVTPKGRKVFVVLYRTGGAGSKLRKYTIGPYGRMTLHQARVGAQKVFAAKLEGRDPATEKREAKRRAVTDRVEDLFDGVKPFNVFSRAKRELDKISGVTSWRLHDLRRTCVSGVAWLGVAPHVADKILNHQAGTIAGVAAVYQRHEFLAERRATLDLWGAHVGELLSGISQKRQIDLKIVA
jgi:hypothetical protein